MSVSGRKSISCSNPWCSPRALCNYCKVEQPPEPEEEGRSRLDGKLEPEAKDGCSSLTEAATLSIAISLKRIADSMEKEVITGEVEPYSVNGCTIVQAGK